MLKFEYTLNGILIKIIDSKQHNLNIQQQYSPDYLRALSAATLDIVKNEPPIDEVQQLLNVPIDIMFNSIEFLKFIQAEFGLLNAHARQDLIILFNADIDNAFYTGNYLVIGNGVSTFSPLCTIDIMAHELGHGIEQLGGLEYQAESGALNESMADCLAASYEFYVYTKFNTDIDPSNDLFGKPDWEIGEDASTTALRNMQHPERGMHPQPRAYKGAHWHNTTNPIDNGGVHINSGVTNHLFYLLSSQLGVRESIQLYMRALANLKNPRASMNNFMVKLLDYSFNKDIKILFSCLQTVKLIP